jgi:DNA-binding winged helix-turn-helix (wHTH) protein
MSTPILDRAVHHTRDKGTQVGWHLDAVQGDVRPAKLLLAGSSWTIGRSQENAIVVAHDAVSRRHAMIVREEGDFRLSDLGSRNGTYLNGKLLRASQILAHRDLIGLGEPTPRLRFVDDHAVADPPPGKSANATVRGHHVRLDYDDRRLRFSLYDRPLDLSPDEFCLLRFLYLSSGDVCARRECSEAVWGADAPRHEEKLDRLVERLRSKLRRLDEQLDIVQTRITGGFILQR